jgi:hypothetical protein
MQYTRVLQGKLFEFQPQLCSANILESTDTAVLSIKSLISHRMHDIELETTFFDITRYDLSSADSATGLTPGPVLVRVRHSCPIAAEGSELLDLAHPWRRR